MENSIYLKHKAREQRIAQNSVLSICVNLSLSVFKGVIGIFSGSAAILSDAVESLSDGLSSLITLLGIKLSYKVPDKKHPFGYGRIEYVSASLISFLVLYAGITSLTGSVNEILHPASSKYTALWLAILGVALPIKFILGTYLKKEGKKEGSHSLSASGNTIRHSSILSASTLAAAIILYTTGHNIEAWFGVIIAVFTLKNGISLLLETMSEILGKRTDAELARTIKEEACSFPQVLGAYDLFVHNYGPGKHIGSVHIEVPENLSMDELDTLERNITSKVYQKTGVLLAGISIYSQNGSDLETQEKKKEVQEILQAFPQVLETHGFYYNKDQKQLQFDIVISFSEKQRQRIYREALTKVQETFPGYQVKMNLDADASD